jgi:hypothetical protein
VVGAGWCCRGGALEASTSWAWKCGCRNSHLARLAGLGAAGMAAGGFQCRGLAVITPLLPCSPGMPTRGPLGPLWKKLCAPKFETGRHVTVLGILKSIAPISFVSCLSPSLLSHPRTGPLSHGRPSYIRDGTPRRIPVLTCYQISPSHIIFFSSLIITRAPPVLPCIPPANCLAAVHWNTTLFN